MPGLALNRLDHHRRRVLADRVAKRLRIVARDGDEPLGQRAEEVVASELGRRRQGAERAAVKAAVEADDLRPVDARGCARLRTSLIAHSLASVPELQRKTAPPRLDSASRAASRIAGSV